MGILDKITQGSSSQKEEDFSLEKHEIEFILLLIKESSVLKYFLKSIIKKWH